MAKFLTTSGVSAQIEAIIMGAKESLTLVTPYLQLNKILEDRLADAARNGVSITFIYGKTRLSDGQLRELRSLKNINLYFLANLHSKCYYNERFMVLSSMNLYEFSEKNNREMGILIDATEDSSIFEDVLREVESMKQSKQVQIIPGDVCDRPNGRQLYFQKMAQKDADNVAAIIYQESSTAAQSEIPDYVYRPVARELVPELDPNYNTRQNFYLPSLAKALQIMYPKLDIKLGLQSIIIKGLPFFGMQIQVWGRVDFEFPSKSIASLMKKEIQWTVSEHLDRVRFYWNDNKLSAYLPKDYELRISLQGVADVVNLYIRIISFTSSKVQETDICRQLQHQ